MESKVSYTIVGLFVLILGSAAVVISLWLMYGDFRREYNTYWVYMTESVSGLYVDAPVKYRGVVVGKVRDLALDPDDPDRVRVTLDIERDVPIKVDTVATLSVQGLTGIASIELSGGSREAPPLEPSEEPPYPVLKTGPSLFTRLDAAISELIENVNQAARDAHLLLSPDNRTRFSQTLEHIAALTGTVAHHGADLDSILQDGALLFAQTAQASTELGEVLAGIQRSTAAMEDMANEIAATSASIRQVVEAGGQDLQILQRQALPELGSLIEELRELALSLQRLTQRFEQEPQSIIFGPQPGPPGPGEAVR